MGKLKESKATATLIKLLDSSLNWLSPKRSRGELLEDLDGGKIERIIILAIWGIGDAVLFSPLLYALKDKYPYLEITLVGKPFLRELFGHSNIVNNFIELAPPWTAFTGKYRIWSKGYRKMCTPLIALRKVRFDLAVSDRADIREHFLLWLMGVKWRVGYGEGAGSMFLTNSLPNDSPIKRRIHRVEAAKEIAEYLGLNTSRFSPRLSVPVIESEMVERLLLTPDGWIAIHPGARIPIRRWSLINFEKVIDFLRGAGLRILLIIGPEGYGKELAGKVEESNGVVVQPSLRELIALLPYVDLLICNDSGPMHIAAALGIPVLAIFGPQLPDTFSPYGSQHTVVIAKPMPCRPCYDKCNQAKPICMEQVTPDIVLKALKSKLETLQKKQDSKCGVLSVR